MKMVNLQTSVTAVFLWQLSRRFGGKRWPVRSVSRPTIGVRATRVFFLTHLYVNVIHRHCFLSAGIFIGEPLQPLCRPCLASQWPCTSLLWFPATYVVNRMCTSDPLNMSLQPSIVYPQSPQRFALQVPGPSTPPLAPMVPVKTEEVAESDAGQEWSEEEWRLWENWDGYEDVKEEIEDIEEEAEGVAEPQEEPEEEIHEREVKRPRSTPNRDMGDEEGWQWENENDTGGYVDKSWSASPWQWSDEKWSGGWGWGWQDHGKKWTHDDWTGSSGSRQSPRQKAPWAYTKGKGKGKRGKKGKQDSFGGQYVRGGYLAPEGQFFS